MDWISDNEPLFTFDTLNISTLNKALQSTNQHYSEKRISQCHEFLKNVLRAACELL